MMQEVKPYQSPEELEKDLDNGGRFYNIFTKADDKIVTSAELVKAAGVVSNEYMAFLYLEMALCDLDGNNRSLVADLLEPELLSRFRKQKVDSLKPSEVEANRSINRSLIVTGYPRFVEDKTSFQGMIMVPTGGDASQFTWIPIHDQFDMYEVFDDPSMTGPSSMVATLLGMKLDDGRPLRFGCLVRKTENEGNADESHPLYLEVFYYTRL